MRLYTIKHHENECVAVKTKAGRLYTLKSLGFDVKDMNTLIRCFGEIKNDIESRLSEQEAEYVDEQEIKNVHNLQIQCFVNGEKRQDSNTSCMITTIEDAIAELSQGMTLKAGTIIATGTPGGVAMGMRPPVFLKEGDVVRCVIEDIGELVNTVGKAT